MLVREYISLRSEKESFGFIYLVPYFGEPVGRVKIQTTSKNSQRDYTTKRLIRDLLSNTPKFYVCVGEFRRYFIYGDCVTEVCEAERNWRGKNQLTDWSTANKPA